MQPREIRAIERETGKQMLRYIMTGQDFKPCLFHPEFKSCYKFLLNQLGKVTKAMLQINIPIQVLPFLIFKLRSIQKE